MKTNNPLPQPISRNFNRGLDGGDDAAVDDDNDVVEVGDTGDVDSEGEEDAAGVCNDVSSCCHKAMRKVAMPTARRDE
jgi:hypothetical protein